MNDPMTDAERAELRDFANRSAPLPVSLMPATVLALLDDRDRLAAENARLRAALEPLIPGYEQYLEWCLERGVMFVSEGRKMLADAREALERKEGP